ncbi:prepilin-type N-terminal cleavage/methylation domain-containing protein [Ureibacillus composti]
MFKQLLEKRLGNEKGLTLVELLAVIVILAIVAAIAIPAVGSIIDNSRYKAAKADAIMILDTANIYFTDNPNAQSVTLGDLKSQGYLDNGGTFSKTSNGDTGTSVAKVSTGNTLTGVATIKTGKTATFTATTIANISDDTQSPKTPDSTIKAATNGKIWIQ